MKRLNLVLVCAAVVAIVPSVFLLRRPGNWFSNDPNETALAPYRKSGSGGFSHRWVAYVTKKGESYSVELNGKTLGPYSGLSEMFKFSPDGQHIAFAAERAGKWRIVLDGQERWAHDAVGWADYSWVDQLDVQAIALWIGGGRRHGRAAVMQFSPDGTKLAYQVSLPDNHWAVAAGGMTGRAFRSVSNDIDFLQGKVKYVGWIGADNQHSLVYGDESLGPYQRSSMLHFSRNREHCIEVATGGGTAVAVVDGRESSLPISPAPSYDDVLDFLIADDGIPAYVYRAGGAERIVFRGKELPGRYDRVLFTALSPSGKHIAFWAKKDKTWSLVTDTGSHSGFDGFFCHQFPPARRRISLLWSSDERHLAYFAREGGRPVIVLDGKKVPGASGKPWLCTNELELDGKIAGCELRSDPSFDEAGFVACLASIASGCTPSDSYLIGGELSYEDDEKKLMIVGKNRLGPFDTTSGLIVSDDKQHFAFTVKTKGGWQVILDGVLAPRVYEAIYRPQFVGNSEFAHLGLRQGWLFRARYPLSQ
jgi:hypothetical protein